MQEAQRFTVDDLPLLAPAWDAAVDRTPGADEFCASTFWSFAAATSFPQAGAPVLFGDGDAFCGLRPVRTVDGTDLLVGLDPVWGFASPLVGSPSGAAAMLRARLGMARFDLAVVAGQRDDSLLTSWVVRTLADDYQLFHGPVEARLQIDLSAGVAPWLARRSGRFRQQLRRRQRAADERGLEIVDLSAMASDEVFDRILTIEARSWKADADTGLRSSDLADFYRQVSARLGAQERLRVLVARIASADVGYILGGVRGGTYRGLQLSYDRTVADLGLGHLLQFEQLSRLEGEGVATYDLGMDMEYKRRWSDRIDETMAVVVRR
ncbi:MAG: GNAT family N-acetyltransferase [Acidimicrobiales bacterium]